MKHRVGLWMSIVGLLLAAGLLAAACGEVAEPAMRAGSVVSGSLVDRLVAPDGAPNPAVQVAADGTTTFYGPVVNFASMDAISITTSGGGLYVIDSDAAYGPQILGGASDNSIDPTAYGAMILGGGWTGYGNTISAGGAGGGIFGGYGNSTSEQWSFIGGGIQNTINDRGNYSVIFGGEQNVCGAGWSFIGGGEYNTIVGAPTKNYMTIVGGSENTVSGAYASVLGGAGAYARSYGQTAHGAGYFETVGDAQTAEYVVRRAVTHSSSAWSSLYADGATSTKIPLLPTDSVATLDILVSGESAGGAKAFSYRIIAVVENDGGTTAILASTVTTLYEDDSDFGCQIVADNTNDGVLVQVRDATSGSDAVRWVAVIRSAEVTFP